MRAERPIRRPSSAPTQPTSTAGTLGSGSTASVAPAHAMLGSAPRRASMDGVQTALPPRTPSPVRSQQPPGGPPANLQAAPSTVPAAPVQNSSEPPDEGSPKPIETMVTTPAATPARRDSTHVQPHTPVVATALQSAEVVGTHGETASAHESVVSKRMSADVQREASTPRAHETTVAPASTTLPRPASSDIRPAEEQRPLVSTASDKELDEPGGVRASTPALAPAKALPHPVEEITIAPADPTTMHRARSEPVPSERTPLLSDIAQRMEAASRRPVAEPSDIYSVIGRMERAAELLSRRFLPDEALVGRHVPAELLAAQERLQHLLDGMQLDPTQNADEQRALKQLYIKENAPIEAAWSVLFGSRFKPGESMQAPFAEGSINAAFESSRGGISSFTRSPARNGSATEWRPRPGDQLTFDSVHLVDALAAGGAIGGLGSYTFEKAIEPSMLEQAAKSNLPMLVPVPPELLAPTPGRVRQTNWRSEDGTRIVRFHIAGLKNDEAGRFEDGLPGPAPHLPKLDSDTQQKRESIATWQQAWNAEHYAALLQPFLTACLNSLQPELLSEAARDQGGSVFAVSAFGSALAGALAAGALNLAKGTPYFGQVRVNDAMGQPQWLNMYVVAGRNPDSNAELARWRDVLGMPMAALKTTGNTLLEVAKFPKEFVLDPLHTVPDLLMRHELPNVFVGVAATAAAEKALEPLVEAIKRGDLKHLESFVTRARYGLASGLNDYLWPIMRDKMNGLKAKTDVRRKERQDIKAADRTRLEANRDRIEAQLLEQQLRLPPLLRATADASLQAQDRTFLDRIAMTERLRREDAQRLRDIAARLPAELELARQLNLMAQGIEQRARIDSKLAPPWASRLTGRGHGGAASTSMA